MFSSKGTFENEMNDNLLKHNVLVKAITWYFISIYCNAEQRFLINFGLNIQKETIHVVF